jgi:alpha-beta hydrolase superfamily lysophospholipase
VADLERVKTDWRKHPAVLLLHGWNAELQYRWLFPMLAQRLNNAGINAVMFELPYHGSRRPDGAERDSKFSCPAICFMWCKPLTRRLRMRRALRRWLRAEGCPVIGVWGISLGGWLAGLLTAHDPSITFAVLMTPIVRMDRALNELRSAIQSGAVSAR